MKKYLTQSEILHYARAALERIISARGCGSFTAWGVPRGGVPAVFELARAAGHTCRIVDSPEEADVIFDDIVDSGTTKFQYALSHPRALFEALITPDLNSDRAWIVFPWESTAEASVEDNIVRLLQYIGEDPKRGGLLETPRRVARAWADWTSGYGVDPASVLKVFEDGAENVDEMVVVRNIGFYSHCEHHMAPFFGTATIAYIPNGRIVGLSKLARLTEVFARRLQVQERLTNQIADAIDHNLRPKGVGVVVRARHMCMESRGVHKQGSETVTSAVRGAIKTDTSARAEFMRLL